MKTKEITLSNGNKTDVFVHFSNKFKGKGGWLILCEVDYKRKESKVFSTYTADSTFIDALSELRGSDPTEDEIQQAYIDRFWDERLEADIAEWIEEIEATQDEPTLDQLRDYGHKNK